ncbi:hypothetical protein V2J09_015787 [Rumex salicifolius]
MAALNNTFAALLILTFILQGKGISGQLEECDISKIQVTVHRTSTQVEGNREFLVVISNVCWCPQSNITLTCDRFQSVEPVDPAVVAVDGSAFLVNGGKPLVNGRPVSFKYAWSERFRFYPLASQINC